ncbi:MAG: branched-chain amino acid ABC transporter permease, partial [Lachnospiraceae bacterium]|nr:branched-chain amino acid ABC transporter permease [Lachnospiraceae bacterium]
PVVKENKKIRIIVIFAVCISFCLYYLPGLKNISSGFAVIIASVTASGAGAWLFPVEEGEEVKG